MRVICTVHTGRIKKWVTRQNAFPNNTRAYAALCRRCAFVERSERTTNAFVDGGPCAPRWSFVHRHRLAWNWPNLVSQWRRRRAANHTAKASLNPNSLEIPTLLLRLNAVING